MARYEPRAGSGSGHGSRKACSVRASGSNSRTSTRSRGPPPSSRLRGRVGGEMWLWRGETGLWERDPATPINFRDNLLGIAFDPREPARGYAVGTDAVGHGGVILRYGKTWTEKPLPAEVQGAGFTAIAFAGRKRWSPTRASSPGSTTELGGLLVNDGSGWTVDTEAAAASAKATRRRSRRSRTAAPPCSFSVRAWRRRVRARSGGRRRGMRCPAPCPAEVAGSLSLFREGGRLRAIVSGGTIGKGASVGAPEVPPGFPPCRRNAAGSITGARRRQRAAPDRRTAGATSATKPMTPASPRCTPATTLLPPRPDLRDAARSGRRRRLGGRRRTERRSGEQTAERRALRGHRQQPRPGGSAGSPGTRKQGHHHLRLRRQRAVRRPLLGPLLRSRRAAGGAQLSGSARREDRRAGVLRHRADDHGNDFAGAHPAGRALRAGIRAHRRTARLRAAVGQPDVRVRRAHRATSSTKAASARSRGGFPGPFGATAAGAGRCPRPAPAGRTRSPGRT